MKLPTIMPRNATKEVKASVAYTICGILNKCFSLITLPIFTRIMSTEEYGLSTVYASTAALVVIFTSLQLPYGSLSTAMIKFKADRNGYLSSICTISIVLTAIYIVLCIGMGEFLADFLGIPFILLIVMGIEMLFSTVTAAWMGYQRFEYKYRGVVVVTLLTSIISVILSLIVVSQAEQKGISRVLANALVVSAIGLILLISVMTKGKKPFSKKYWKYALSFNIPLIPYYLSQVVFNQSDRLMIDKICGRSDAAIYGVAYSMATILSFVVTAVHSSYTPWIFERIDEKNVKDTGKVSLILSAGIAFMLLGIVALAPEVIYIMAGKDYMDAVWAITPVAVSVLLLYYANLFDCILFFYEAKVFLAVATIFSAIINVVLNYFFIPIYGFVAAAYTTLASYLILATMDYFYMLILCKKHNIDSKIYNIKWLIVLLLIFGGISALAMSLYYLPLVRYGIILIVFVLLFANKKRLINLYGMLKRN